MYFNIILTQLPQISNLYNLRISAKMTEKGGATALDMDTLGYFLYMDSVEEIGEAEGFYIRQYLPALNTQIPKESDWRKYDYNANALTVTLEEILKDEE